MRGVEEITGTTIEADFEVSIPSVHNDSEITRLISKAAEDVVGSDNVLTIPRPSMGSEDFACYLEHVPGAMFRLGCCTDLAAPLGLHTPLFDLDETALAIGSKILARSVVMACETYGVGL